MAVLLLVGSCWKLMAVDGRVCCMAVSLLVGSPHFALLRHCNPFSLLCVAGSDRKVQKPFPEVGPNVSPEQKRLVSCFAAEEKMPRAQTMLE